MIYFGFSNKDNQNCKERDNSFFVKLLISVLSFFIPKANPDFEQLYEDVHQWYLEYDELNKETCREIGIDSYNRVIVKAPYSNNYGYWADNNMTIEKYSSYFDIEYISKEDFESMWAIKIGNAITGLCGKAHEGTGVPWTH